MHGYAYTQNKIRLTLPCLLLAGLALLLAACGASRSEAPAMSAEAVAPQEAGMARDQAAALIPPGGYADGISVPLETFLAQAVQAQEQRVIIYTGNISLIVKDTEESIRAITQLVSEHGGYVAGSNVYQSGEALRGSISVRVPAERYQTVMEGLRSQSVRVERENSSSEDVTEEFTDLQARKDNLQRTEAAMQTLLEERQRTGSTSDILEVYRELTDIRGQIEQIEGRLRYLANQSALSTINIELIPDVLSQPVTIGTWQPQGVAKEALKALIVALQGVTNLLIWLTIFVLPLALVVLLPLVVLVLLLRWWLRRRKAAKKVAAPKAAE